MHPSERAQVMREVTWDALRGCPSVPPGSAEEAEALARIDAARDAEQAALGDTFAKRRQRAERWWGRGRRSVFEG